VRRGEKEKEEDPRASTDYDFSDFAVLWLFLESGVCLVFYVAWEFLVI
jgi:hypothetical protein